MPGTMLGAVDVGRRQRQTLVSKSWSRGEDRQLDR